MTRISLLATGGTIACTTDSSGALSPTITGTELAEHVQDLLPAHITLSVRELTQLDSSAITLSELDALINAIQEELANPEVAGVVVTHGTDSMEDTALAVDIFHQQDAPVVLTGAQRAFDHPSSDGPGNLLEAIELAADPLARGQGVLIAFGGWTIPARGAAKRHTNEIDAFISTTPIEVSRPAALSPASLSGIFVPVIAAWPGSGRELIDAALAAGAQGLIVEGLGSGNTGPQMGAGIQDALAQGIPVVITTRVPAGEVALAYAGAGGGSVLAAAGAVGAGYLRAGQARIVLIAALATGVDVRTLL
ncbi:asparaginase [Corynebacterium alimapuense]|uniref:asparaginase n=1 Tax=Corynebacterium alimapuense TaxID=1576874 RepID=A0A3M8KAI9_9CORY|nr:asparaginase [Corynebacterium alimapuense]RNE49478.1 asparaginase [Corynebacterium alimapuense]